MDTRRTSTPSAARQNPLLVWLGFILLVASLLAPLVSLQETGAAQATGVQTEQCDPGFSFDERTGACEPDTPGGFQQVPRDCPDDEVRNPDTGRCVPSPTEEPPLVQECPEGTVLNQQTGRCDPATPVDEATEAATETPELAEPPQQEPENQISLVKLTCPEGTGPDLDLAALQQACPVTPGVEFTLTFGGGATSTTTTDASGELAWLGIASGPIAIQETGWAAFGDIRVFCHYVGINASTPVDPVDGQIAGTLDPDAYGAGALHFTCTWVNFEPGDTNMLSLTKYRCPLGAPFDALGEDIFDICTDTPAGIPFDLSGAGAGQPAETDASGQITWTGLPQGSVDIHEGADIDGYEDQIVYCRWLAAPAELGLASDYFPVPAPEGTFTATFDATGMHLDCGVFNLPREESRVLVNKRACAPHIDLVITNDNTIDDIIDACPLTGEGIQFALDNAHGSSTQAIDGGFTMWDGVPHGPFDLAENIPFGYDEPVWYCATNAFDENGDLMGSSDWELVASPGGVISGSIDAEFGEIFTCWVFNPLGEDSTTITLEKRLCPPGYDLDIPMIDPVTDCSETFDGVTFTLDQAIAQQLALPRETGDDGPGMVMFIGLDPGTWTVTEELPDGIVDAEAWCPTIGPGGPQVFDDPPRATFDIEAGEAWFCYWFNVPEEPEENSLLIRKWVCPPGTGHEESQGWYEGNCLQQHDGVTFTVTSSTGVDAKQTAGGAVGFDPLPAGEITIAETIPAGFGEPVVFCGAGATKAPVDAGAPLGTWTHTFADDGASDALYCYVYNILSENRTAIAHKFICPEGLEPESEDFQDWQDTCTEAAEGVEFTLTDADGDDTKTTSAAGWVPFYDVAQGDVSLTEHTPPGFQEPIVFCSLLAFEPTGAIHSEGIGPAAVDGSTVSRSLDFPGFLWSCFFFNIPEAPEHNDVEITKWICPEGASHEESKDWYEANCTTQHDGVEFTVASDIGIAQQETMGGQVAFNGLPAGSVGIQETIPDGYGVPVVFCGVENSIWQQIDAPTGHWQHDFPFDGVDETFICDVYNIPGEPGSITILKWTCPPGYDLNAAAADPTIDCTEATDGIPFQFGLDSLAAIAQLQTTGDIIPGGVVFDGLAPDTYKAVEVVPDGTAEVFVWECTGHIMGVLQPNPLATGNVLGGIDLDAGEHLTCRWYNVPEEDGGKLTVTKYICTTETFVSTVDCEIFEDGQTFDLLIWNSGNGVWDVVDTQVTDGAGTIVWPGLPAGDYRLDEHGGQWCHLTTTPEFGPGEVFGVVDGDETTVAVYNCDPDWDTTTIPEKYPNTGVPPTSGAPALALAGLLAWPLTRRRLAALLSTGFGLAVADAGAQPASPTLRRPCLPATPAAGAATCSRGSVPTQIRIDAIGVDAPIEVLEVVGGVMQQPTDEVHVAWYKESARLGEIGNLWLAGHLNWWTTPEAVFSDLAALQPGDTVVLADGDGTAFAYAVAWVRQESNLAPPRAAVLGMTDHPAVTLITCSGAWNSDISEYDTRTVVRAELRDA